MDIVKTPVTVSSRIILNSLAPLKSNLSTGHLQRKLTCQNIKEMAFDISQGSVLQYTRQKHSSMYQLNTVRKQPEAHFPKLKTSLSLDNVNSPKKEKKRVEHQHIQHSQSASQSTYTKRVTMSKNKNLPKYLYINGIKVIEGKIKMDEPKIPHNTLPHINNVFLNVKKKSVETVKEEINNNKEKENVKDIEVEPPIQDRKRLTSILRASAIRKMPQSFSNKRGYNSTMTQNQRNLKKTNVKSQKSKTVQPKQSQSKMAPMKDRVNQLNYQARSYRDKMNTQQKAERTKKESPLQKNKNLQQRPFSSYSQKKIGVSIPQQGNLKTNETTPYDNSPSNSQAQSLKSFRRNPLKYHFEGKRGQSTQTYSSYTNFVDSRVVRKQLTLKSLEQEWATKSESSLTSTPWSLANTVVKGLSKLFFGTGSFFSKK